MKSDRKCIKRIEPFGVGKNAGGRELTGMEIIATLQVDELLFDSLRNAVSAWR